MEFPLGLFGIALATVTLPYLARQAANKSYDEFAETLDWSMKLVFLIAVPAAIGLIVLAEPLVATIFYGGVFTGDDVRMTALALQAFAVGLIGFSYVKILAPAYFAREDTRTPVKVGLIALAVNFALSVSLAWYLTRIGFAGSHAGLALAISVAALLNAYLLYRGLRQQGVARHGKGWTMLLARTAAANAVMTAVLIALQRPLSWWLESGILARVAWLATVILLGVAAYFVVLFVLGMRTRDFRLRQN
jgi:putative peptidoglycan lipid II flippase